MVDSKVEVVTRRSLVAVTGLALVAPLATTRAQAQTATDRTLAQSARDSARAALAEIEDIASNAATAPSIAHKLNVDGGNVGGSAAELRAAIGADLTANVNFTPAGRGAIVRSAQDKARDTVSVKDFGAMGNGLANDTAAIRAALAYAATLIRTNANQDSQQAGGVTVHIPDGVYNIDDTLVIVNGVYLVGSGKTSSVLQNLTTNRTLIRNDAGTVYNAFSGGISNLALYGNRASRNQWGVDFLRPLSTVVEHVYVQNMGAGGCRIRQGLSSELRHVYVVGCSGPGFLTGEGIASWANPIVEPTHYPTNGVTFSECHAVRNDGAGFVLGPYTNGCTISGGASEYNYRSAGDNEGYNVELINTGSYMPNVIVDFWCEGPVKAHVLMDADYSTNRLVRFKHFGGGVSGPVDRAVIVKSGVMHLDQPFGHGAPYKAIDGNITPFRLDKTGPAIIHLTNPQGSTLTRESVWVEDETGATGNLSNNLYQSASGVVRGAAPKVYTDHRDAGPAWFREDEKEPYLRVEPFHRELAFGDGVTAPDVGLKRLAARTLGLGDRGEPRFLQLGGAWNGNHALLGAYHLWVDATGALRIKNGAPRNDVDGTVVGTQIMP